MADLQRYPKSSGTLLAGSILGFTAGVLLLISFASPYWLESYPETFSEFVRLGLWDVCFHNYRHPSYQYDEKFDGCYWIFSYKYQNIRDWLQPGWMILVQALMTIALLFSLKALFIISMVLMRFVMKLEVFMLAVSALLQGITALLIFLAVAIFGGMCFDRTWILYPIFNHLSWAYGLAVIAFFFHVFAAACLLSETFKAKERRQRANNLIYNMQPSRKMGSVNPSVNPEPSTSTDQRTKY
ncbi:uncharacterized protein LOC106472719 [Limulus polyphemus]|uniref:Uncharacterized protein LOC106472719 n=1 Tax=Limulus polyphemus TaxID=6850 RepID=A0ABM1BUC8_LIMPO|nr:uncharacterized protein LOC106472719 [Limulus polyphemus]XP_013788829.2 uncharacterized protein LOC106472719 [Limulus polyphemus]XP_022256966.1 uncharacterized protein LOC106472719 [Limulus polyphemus]XP_022256967.1 uncharacterized protein LOC106472719 [Limulus polyphemus]